MTKKQYIILIIPILILDVLFSIWYVYKYQPQSDTWKIPVFFIVSLLVVILSLITSKKQSKTYWKAILLIPAISTSYMLFKNAILGIVWHMDMFYIGSKGFDGWLIVYVQNGEMLFISLIIATLVFSGLWNYVK